MQSPITAMIGGSFLVSGLICGGWIQRKSGAEPFDFFGRAAWKTQAGREFWACVFVCECGLLLLALGAYDPC